MRIALDYDGTYTSDPVLWLAFVELAQMRGHEIVCCTLRSPEEMNDMDAAFCAAVRVIPTSRQAKAKFCKADVWIDDFPHQISG